MPLVTEPMGTSCSGHRGKERLKDVAAHLAVQFAYAVDLTAATYSKIGHVKGFRGIPGILPSHGEQIVHGNAKFILRVVARDTYA